MSHFVTKVNVISYENVSSEPITEDSAKKIQIQENNLYTGTYIPEFYYFDYKKVRKIRNLVVDFGKQEPCFCPCTNNHYTIDTNQFFRRKNSDPQDQFRRKKQEKTFTELTLFSVGIFSFFAGFVLREIFSSSEVPQKIE